MAKPTEAEIKKYEAEHKILFVNLVLANILWLNMPGKYGFDPTKKDSQQYKAWYNMGMEIGKILFQWRKRQEKLESVPNGGVQKIPISVYTDFFKKDKIKTLKDIALKMIKPGTAGEGLGFIPLIIWGVIALVAALSAAYIIDETTTTTQEKAKLLKVTSDTLKELNIPPDKAAQIISDTQQQASENKGLLNSITGGGFGGMLLPLAAVAAFLFFNKNKSTT